MTPYEKRALRRWVASGHSVMEAPPSRYACIHCCYPPPSFLDVYREDKQLDAATRGMTKSEKASYLKEYVGFPEESAEERAQREANQHLHEQTPEAAREVIRTLGPSSARSSTCLHFWQNRGFPLKRKTI